MMTNDRRSRLGGGVIGLSLGKYAFVGGGVLSVLVGPVLAGPQGEQVVRGNATFHRNGNLTTIEAGNNTIINYSSFNIGRHEAVQFIQPSAASRVLNRINGAAPTHIDGSLTANGTVYFVNPAGVMFGKDAVINVGGIFAAAGHLSDENFLAGINHFQNVQGAVVNDGVISAGAAHFIGKQVANNGVVLSRDAMTMVAGNDVYIGEWHGRMMVKVDATAAAKEATPVSGPGVSNTGTVRAGRVSMAAGDVYSLAIRNTGTVQARSIALHGGATGKVEVSGTLDASATEPGRTGGTVEVLGERVTLDGATIDASGPAGGGTVLVGGDYQGRPGTRTAQRTAVSKDSVVRADATERGDGGKIIFWADDVNGFFGHASARGGAAGGDGGLVEVSGKNFLAFEGTVDATAPSGRIGTLLLDPKNVSIVDNNPDAVDFDDVDAFDDGPGSGNNNVRIHVDRITDQLALADVAVRANTDINVETDIISTDAHGLTLEAGRSIIIHDGVTISLNGFFTGHAGHAGASDGNRDDGAAEFRMGANSVISTVMGNGDIIISVGTGPGGDEQTGAITLGSLLAGDGHILVTNTGTTAGSGIVRASGTSLISGASAAFSVTEANAGIGASGAPLRLAVTNVEALGRGGGVYLESPSTTDNLNIGSAGLGGLTGISTTNGGVLSIRGQAGVTANEAVNVAGGVTINARSGVNLQANFAAEGVTTLNTDTDGDGTGGLGLGGGFTLSTTNDQLTIIASGLNIGAGASITTGTGLVEIMPPNETDPIGLGSSGVQFNVRQSDFLAINTTNAVYVGRADGRHTVTIGADEAINLSSKDFDLLIRSPGSVNGPAGPVTFSNFGLTGSPDRIVNFNTGSVTGLGGGATSVTVGGTQGTVRFNTDGSITQMNTSVAALGESEVTGDLNIVNHGAIDLAATVVNGNLSVTAAGAITDSGALTVTGDAVFTTRDNAGAPITLDEAGSTFGSVAAHVLDESNAKANADIMLVESGEMNIAGASTLGSATFNATGAITDSGVMDIGGTTTFRTLNDGGANITIDHPGSRFGPIIAAARNASDSDNANGTISITESDDMTVAVVRTAGSATFSSHGAMDLADVVIGGAGTFNARGELTDSGAIRVNGATTFRTLNDSGAAITLDHSGNVFGALTVATRNANDTANVNADIVLNENDEMILSVVRTAGNGVFTAPGHAMTLGSVQITGTGTFEAGGPITDSAALTIGGVATFRTLNDSGAAITLDNSGSTFGSIKAQARNAADNADAAGAIDIREQGTMDVALVSSAAAITLRATEDINISGPVSAGAADITLRPADGTTPMALNDTGASFALTAADLAQLSTTGTVHLGASGGTGAIFIGSAGALNLSGETYNLALHGGAVTFSNGLTLGNNRTLTFNTGAVDGSNALVDITIGGGAGTVVFNTTGSVDVDAAVDRIGASTIGGSLNFANVGVPLAVTGNISTGSNNVTLTADSLEISSAINAGSITLRPFTAGRAINLNDAAGGLDLSAAELALLNTTGLVSIGQANSGPIAIGGAGAIDLSGKSWSGLTLRGGETTFSDTLTLPDNSTLTMLTGAVNASGTGVDIRIGGTTGSLAIDAAGAIGSGVSPLSTEVDRLAARAATGGVYVTNAGTLTLATIGGVAGVSTTTTGQTVELTTTAGDLNAASGAGVTASTVALNAAGKIGATGAVATATDTLTANAGTGIDIANTSSALTATLTSADGLAKLTTTGTLAMGGAWSAGSLDVAATDLEITQNITTTGDTAIRRSTPGTIGVAGVNPGDFGMALTTAELQRITAASLTIGGDQTTSITISGYNAAALPNIGGTVTLLATAQGGDIIFGPSSSSFPGLVAVADNGIDVNAAITSTGVMTMDGDADNAADGDDAIRFAPGLEIVSAGAMTLDATTGGVRGQGNLTLRTTGTGSDLTINDTVNVTGTFALSSGGAITLNTTTAGATIEITSEDGITFEDDVTTNGATVINADSNNDGTGTLTVASDATVSTMGNTLEILAADLVLEGQIVTGEGGLTIRQSTGGPIALVPGVDPGLGSGTLTISGDELARMTAGSLTIGGSNTSQITVNGIQQGNVAGIAGAVTLDATGTGGTIEFTGDTSIFKELNVYAAAGVTANAGFGSGTHNLTINADRDGSGDGVLTVASGRIIGSSGGTIRITAADLNLAGSITTTGGELVIGVSDGGAIGLGATEAAGGMNISAAELSRMTARTLTLGGSDTGAITVDGISGDDSAGISELVTLTAGAPGGRIAFSGGASTFRALRASADNGIAVDANIVASSGELRLNGDLDGAADGLDGITIAAGRLLSSAGLMTLESPNGGITAAGALTLSAGDLNLVSPLIAVGQHVTISRAGTGTIGLGDATGDMSISGDELRRITADKLTIGGNQTTRITVDNVKQEHSENISGELVLQASANGGDVRFINNPSVFNVLTVNADDGVLFGADVSARLGALNVDGDLDNAADTNDAVTLEADVDLNAGGALTIRATTGGIVLTGAAGTTNIIAAGGDQMLTLDRVRATADANLTLTSQGGISLSGVNLGDGDFTAIADADSDTANVTFTLQDITARDITLSTGNDNNDTITIATDFTAGRNLTIRDVSVVELGGNVDLTAGGHINISNGVGTIRLSGEAGTTNVLDANNDGSITLGAVTAPNNASLVLNAENAIAVASVDLGSGTLTINVDDDNDGTHTGTFGALTVGALIARGSGGNDTLTFNGPTVANGPGGISITSGAIVLGGNVTSNAGPITLTGSTVLNNDLTISTEAGDDDISFQGVIGGSRILTVDAGSGDILFGGAVGSATALNGLVVSDAGNVRFESGINVGAQGLAITASAIRLAGDVQSVGDVTFAAPVTLANDLTIAGNDITFSSTINSDEFARNLVINTTGNGATSFAGTVGGISPLASLFTNADGTTRLGADIYTAGSMTFLDAVVLTRDVLLRDTGSSGIAFGSTINSDAAVSPRALTLLVNTQSTDPLNPQLAVISFGGDIGNTAQLSNLYLNYDPGTGADGRATPTAAATIVARPLDANGQPIPVGNDFNRNFGVSIKVRDNFVMGRHEKFTSLGGLSITAGSQARLGDLTSANDMAVTAPSIVLRARNAGVTLNNEGLPDFDTGLDIVGRTVNFSVTPTIEGEGFPPVTFGTEDGTGDVAGTLTGFSFRSFGSTNAETFVFNNRVLDARSAGPTNTNIAPTIAGAIPRERQSGDISQDTTVGQSQQEQLRQLGIFARELRLDEFLAFLVGRSIYNDYPTRVNPDPLTGGYSVAVTRLAADRVEHLLATYDSIYNRDVVDETGQPVIDPQTGRTLREPRTEQIRESLQQAVRDFRRSEESRRDFDPVAFRAYLERTPEHAEALQYVQGLQDLLEQLALIGLTPLELNVARDTLLMDITPRGVRPVELHAVITGQPVAVSPSN